MFLLALLGNGVNTLRFCPLGLQKQLPVTYMLCSNALLILYYVFTLRSCDRAVGVRYLISMQARHQTTILMDYACATLASKLLLLFSPLEYKVEFL